MKKILLTILILIQNTGYAEQYTNESLKKDKDIPLKQSKCILFEKNNLIIDFTNLNKAGHYLLSVSLSSNKDFMAGFFCVKEPNEKSEAYHCMGECDAGRLWVKIDEKGHNVKFGNIRLDTDYIKEGTDDIDSKYIDSKDTNYTQGIYVPCL
jgi:hypothetical protein